MVKGTDLVIVSLLRSILVPPILVLIFKQSCANVISLHDSALFAWIHCVVSPFLLNNFLILSFLISAFPFFVSQILFRSPNTKTKLLRKQTYSELQSKINALRMQVKPPCNEYTEKKRPHNSICFANSNNFCLPNYKSVYFLNFLKANFYKTWN